MFVVELRNVSYTYPGARPVTALEDISFDARDHEFVSLIGPSGCGKSTLLRLIADLLPATSGTVNISGRPARMARERRDIGFVFQDPALMPWRNSLKNVRLPLEVLKRSSSKDMQRERDLLSLVGLADFEDKRPDQLSGGMKQRVSIARALTYDPQLLLMDEPFGALDQITRDDMNNELLRIWEQTRSTIIFVTHSIPEAIFLSDRVVVLSPRPGRIADVVNVPLPRPRDAAIKRSSQFFEIETHVLAALEGRVAYG